ncbi:DUF2948 family protein [Pseudoruegeria sp. SHC-113]|uniref:DUF2948 family protein n=1 Tax=Pseudoruegeria sp. SHC-113 TaxID=2855439 RepID=UPI0021BBB157|nr:DUF2948 family protein [Pseudoruegeria sp. SHC-113]MCT8161697.1 DUF2948 family protein [Pseudoruegeria sp. SHC-113]
MQEDARFEDGGEAALHLKALDAEDLQVIASLTQDAVFPATEMTWQPKERRFALLLNRFRWEDLPQAEKRHRPYERVQSVLAFDSVLSVQSQGVQRGDADTVLSLLSVDWQPGEDAAGIVEITLAGDGAIRLQVECLEATLKDVTRPYLANARHMPHHPD